MLFHWYNFVLPSKLNHKTNLNLLSSMSRGNLQRCPIWLFISLSLSLSLSPSLASSSNIVFVSLSNILCSSCAPLCQTLRWNKLYYWDLLVVWNYHWDDNFFIVIMLLPLQSSFQNCDIADTCCHPPIHKLLLLFILYFLYHLLILAIVEIYWYHHLKKISF